MGITYKSIDEFLLTGRVSDEDRAIIEKFHACSEHKRAMPIAYERQG